jgi:predicted CXXCH cytochrome family protein
MKKTMIIGLISLLSIVLVYGFADATVGGRCDNCHTMHNSQGGAAMNYDASATPNALLLRGSCIGCHAQNTAANIVNSVIPQVLHINATDLAGGNFKYCTDAASQNKVHNVSGLSGAPGAQDTVLLNNPPGFLAAYDPASPDFNTTNRLVCAGANGCHGNRDQANQDVAIKGSHHYSDTMLKFGTINEATQGGGTGGADVVTTGKSYRFLYNVHGGEDSDWQATSGAADHNEYKGVVFGTRGQTQVWSDVTAISDLCAECHGQFHAGGLSTNSGIGSASPWNRHPTDALLPNSGEYASYTSYNVQVPVGRPSIPTAASNTVSPGTDVVACVSCHAAHGTNYADILRWDYTGSMTAGTGCLRCHTQKSAY